MKCALWLGGKKITSASEIPMNFDISSVRGYFLGGCLAEWLCDNGGSEYVEKINKLSPDDEHLNAKLMEIFGQAPCEIKLITHDSALFPDENAQAAPTSYGGGYCGSFAGTSFGASSFNGSFSFGSFSGRSGSFSSTSFGFGSFGRTSFGYSSFGYSSFALISTKNSAKVSSGISYGSRNPDITPCASDSSFFMTDEEYDELVRQSFAICPLNMFGYGIDNI